MTIKFFATSILGLLLASASAFSDEIRGVIDKVDAAKGELSVMVRGRGPRGLVLSFKLAQDAQIHAGRQSTDLSDLHPGERRASILKPGTGNGSPSMSLSGDYCLARPRRPLENRKSCRRPRRSRRIPTPSLACCNESR